VTPIALKSLFTINIAVSAQPQVLGALPQGYARRVVPVIGGNFKGERLSGKVLPGGADSVIECADGGLHLDVRLVLETDEGELVYMTYMGRKTMNREGHSGDAHYFRVLVQFETSAPRLLWLNDRLGVGTGMREPEGPVYDVWEVG
jgi:hypothetical protein